MQTQEMTLAEMTNLLEAVKVLQEPTRKTHRLSDYECLDCGHALDTHQVRHALSTGCPGCGSFEIEAA